MRYFIFWITLLLPTISLAQNRLGSSHVLIDALDADAWNGIVFHTEAFHKPVDFALRIGSLHRHFLDGYDVYKAVREVGPHAPGGSYCRMAWVNPPRDARITLEWSRIDQTTVVGRLTAPPDIQLVLETYAPGNRAVFSADASSRTLLGERYFDNVFGTTAKFLMMTDRTVASSGTFPSVSAIRDSMLATGRLISEPGSNPVAAAIQFVTDGSRTAHFVAMLGSNEKTMAGRAQELLRAGTIGSILQERAGAYAARRPRAKGLFEGAAQAIGNTMFWNKLYAPSIGLAFPSISRSWAHNFGGWVVGEWDCFFGSLLTSLEDKDQTLTAIRAMLLAQTGTGVVPNIASGDGITPDRSEPPVGSYLVWKVYQRFPDREFLAWAYPRLKKWHEWWFRDRGDGQPWRDGNRDGLLEWGSDRGSSESVGGRGFLLQAKWESGLDDSPMYDDARYNATTYTLNLDDVGLNSLYTLDAECLARLSALLGRTDDSRRFTAEYETMKQRIRDRLWNERDGIYENRFWDGEFSSHLSPTNFYPMLAGIATPEQARRMVKEHLLNPREFWGTYVAPTIARNDSAFSDQFSWRGDIWGPTNYLVYQGLNRYKFDKTAFTFAEKGYELFMDDWRTNQHSDENYRAWGGNGGGDIHYTWGTLLCLAALEQYIDVNPWEGLRFGALSAKSTGEFRSVHFGNHEYDVIVGPHRTAMFRDGKLRFEAKGPVVVRGYQFAHARLDFIIKSPAPVDIASDEFGTDPIALTVDGKAQGNLAMQEGRLSFALPAGEHRVELRSSGR